MWCPPAWGFGSIHRRYVDNDPTIRSHNTIRARAVSGRMRSEDEVREQYEFLREQLDDEEMQHRGVEELFTHYKRALGWVLEEEHM